MKSWTVEKVEVNNGKNGNTITFNVSESIRLNTYIALSISGKEYYFQICSISTDNNSFVTVTAKEVGYYNRINRVDIRDIIDSFVILVLDKERQKQIEQESRYC